MIVVDASALLEVMLRTSAADAVERRLFAHGQTLHAPHLVDVEVAQVIRGYAAKGEINGERQCAFGEYRAVERDEDSFGHNRLLASLGPSNRGCRFSAVPGPFQVTVFVRAFASGPPSRLVRQVPNLPQW